ncbi:PASTA domain-containing protein [Streptomyces sp. AN091965]|uniref:PASTA domain-containing protein n=1 Tax=Streptomyces sp. AN091965 TaxID=2927803 RepID=UPI001F607228|nr:PASTA domain-containing protein [Streptomyces sp. AN091965]MCI3932361.1 PASTA domain-containing protein [Streptomyces sp. AN091965]
MPRTPGDAGPLEVRVPRFVGLMAMDARKRAAERGVRLVAGDRSELDDVVLEYVVRQYPLPEVEVPRGAVVTVWFDLGPGEGEGGAGVREPRLPGPSDGGLQRELAEPGQPEVGVGAEAFEG